MATKRKAGIGGSKGLSRVRDTLQDARAAGEASGRNKAHATQSFNAGQSEDEVSYAYDDKSDIGTWVETPQSSRVSRFRYDYMNQKILVQWRNNANHGYAYLGVPTSTYEDMVTAASKGRFVNSPLNGFEYRLMTPAEVHAPSNHDRRANA